jgi:putative transposase
MRAPYTELYVHLIWATWDRLPLISSNIEGQVYASIAKKCQDCGCDLLAVGGIEDHVHLLVKLNPAVAVADLIREIKGSSSHLVTHEIQPGEFFKWQGAYRAFSVRKLEVDTIGRYIQNQKEHHRTQALNIEWEEPAE